MNDTIKSWLKSRIFLLIPIIALVVSFFDNSSSPFTRADVGFPSGFYQLLRILVCAFSAYCAYIFRKNRAWLFLLLSIAAIFNPFFPADLSVSVWQIVNLTTLIILLILFFKKLPTE